MSEALVNYEQPVREKFVVDNDMKAEWCLSKIRKIKAERDREKEELNRQMQFYMDQMDMIDHQADEDIRFFEEMLKGYFQSRVEEGFTKATKTKVSYKLPTGELILKHVEQKYDAKSEEFVKWLQENKLDDYTETKVTAKWGEFKKTLKKDENGNIATVETDEGLRVLTKDGEIVPGVTVTKMDDEFSVEVK